MRDRAGAHVFRRRLDAGADQREMRVDLILVEGGKALTGGARRSGRQRRRACDDHQHNRLQDGPRPVVHRFLLFRSGGECKTAGGLEVYRIRSRNQANGRRAPRPGGISRA
jgi:hypothetical protein